MLSTYLAASGPGLGIADTIQSCKKATEPFGKHIPSLISFLISNIVIRTLIKIVPSRTTAGENAPGQQPR